MLGGSLDGAGVQRPRCFSICLITCWSVIKMSYEDFFTRIPSDYYLKDVNRRVDTMDFGDFVTLENEVKDAFHNYNKGVMRIFERAKARSSVYLHNPRIFFNDIEKFLGWV